MSSIASSNWRMSCTRFVPQTPAISTDTDANRRTCRLEYWNLSAGKKETCFFIGRPKGARSTNQQIAHRRVMAFATIQCRGEVCAEKDSSRRAHRKRSHDMPPRPTSFDLSSNPLFARRELDALRIQRSSHQPATLKNQPQTSHTQHNNSWFTCQTEKNAPIPC